MTPSRRPRDDDGMGVVLVVIATTVVGMLLAVVVTTVVHALHARASHAAYDGAFDAAETGIDVTLAALDANRRLGIGPDVDPAVAAAGRFPSLSAERAWVLAALNARPPTATPTAEYAAIRPAGLHTVYSIGWWPSKARAQRTRLLKLDFVSVPRPAGGAILTAGDIRLGGSFDVVSAPGVTAPADVHSNGNITGNAASTTVTGAVSASGTSAYAGSSVGVPQVEIPTISPRNFYDTNIDTYRDNWYDLCPDGQVHSAPPRAQPPPQPCSGPVASVPGWTYNGSWTEGRGAPNGVYYVYRADAVVDLSRGTAAETVVTESSRDGTCPAAGDGDITVTSSRIVAFATGTVLLSGNDLTLGTQAEAVGGLVGAQGAVTLYTSSARGVRGFVVADNLCFGSPNWFQGSGVAYDPAYAGGGYTRIQVLAESELSLG